MKRSFANKLLVLAMAALMLLGVLPLGALADELEGGEALAAPVAEQTVEPAAAPEITSEPETTPESDVLAVENANPTFALDGAPASVTVTFAASGSTFIFAPKELTVTGGTAMTFGYGDNDGQFVSVLDVLVAAHLELYEDFKDSSKKYLEINESGYVTTAFGSAAGASGYTINGKMSMEMAPKAEISNGDTLRFFWYQDTETYRDYYAEFTKPAVTTLAGDSFGLQLVGHSLFSEMMGYEVKDEPLAGAYVSVSPVNADGSLGASMFDDSTDEDGVIKVTIDTAGDYLLTVNGFTAEGEPLVLPWCRVTVGGMAGLSFAAGSSATAASYTMEPAFDASVTSYTVTVPDNKNGLYAKMTLDSGVSSTLTAEYTNTSGESKSVTLRNGQSTQLAKALSTASMTGVDITVSVGDKTYTIHVVREGTLKGFSLADKTGSKVSYTPNFSATKNTYEANLSGAELNITPTATTSTNSVNINGEPTKSGTGKTVALTWDENHEATVTITIGSSSYTLKLKEKPVALTVGTLPTKTQYDIGETFDPGDMTLKATYADGTHKEIGKDDFTVETNGKLTVETEVTLSHRGVPVAQPITMTRKLVGEGTAEKPYLLATAADLALLSEMTNAGESFAGKRFEITENITLASGWTPIGAKGTYFSGSIDGKNHLITIPAGEQTMIGAPLGAKLENLNIYGENIDGNGVVAIYTTGKTTQAIEIANVTLKSGSKTSGAGFVGGYASGGYKVYIHDCTVEAGVVIGDGTGSRLGSFGGDFNGTIENCKSYATVKGVDYIGGISGSKGQSMGDYKIINCTFGGTVEATGNYIGGIAGGGYDGGTFGPSANTPSVTIQNCTATGKVKGGDRVGGIFGGEPYLVQCWSNGTGYIQNNRFTGSITSTGAYVGGVIGYMHSLNKYTIIENNVYLCTGAGTDKGIGGVKYIDTSYKNPTAVSGVTYFNTANGQSSGVSGAGRTDHNRTDDPLGADAFRLATSNAPSVAVEVLIDAIGTVTAESETAIASAREAYNSLTEEEKAAVANYDKLTAAEAALETVKTEAAAAAVEALIDAIGDPEAVAADSKSAIEAARKAYDALGDETKALVTNYAKLTAAERRLAALDPQGGTKVIGTGSTRLVLDGVTYMVNAEAASLMKRIADLRDAGGMNDEGILDAYRTYDSMSRELKAQVFNFADLQALCTALGVRGHRDGMSGIRAEGLPWYVGLEVTAITSGADYDTVAGSIGHNELLALWNIAFVNRLTGETFTPYENVTLRMDVPAYDAALEQFRMALYADGRVAYSDCTVANGKLSWTVLDGGVYGFLGGMAAAEATLELEEETETAAPETPEETPVPTAEPAAAEPAPRESESPVWLWIVVGAAGVALLIVAIVLKKRDRERQRAAKH